jgi:hypothetical protein
MENRILFKLLKKKMLFAMVLLPDACGPVNTMKSLISISQAETGPKLLIVSFGMTFFSYFIQVVPEY